MLIDSHVHMPAVHWPDDPRNFLSVDDAVEYLRNTGTDAAIFNTWQGVLARNAEDIDKANADALELTAEYDGYLYPGLTINPVYPELSKEWLIRYREMGYKWVGELVFYFMDYRYTDQAFLDLCAECDKHGHILQLHTSEDILEVAKTFPELPIVCSHIDIELLPRLAEYENISLDISGSAGGLHIGALEKAFKILGADRLLYGTDYSSYEPRAFQARLNISVLDETDRQKIQWQNVKILLEKAGSKPISVLK